MKLLKIRGARFFYTLQSILLLFLASPVAAQDSLNCDISFQGILDEPRVSLFIKNYADTSSPNEKAKLPSFSILCLNSPGGDYAQAMRLIDIIKDSIGIVTYIPSGAECISACSLVFLSGNTWVGQGATKQYNARILHVGGALGFHAPFTNFNANRSFSGRDGNKIFSLAVRALSEANSLRLQKRSSGEETFNDFLFSGFISTPPKQLFFINTVGDAVLGDVDIRGLPIIREFDKKEMYRVCDLAVSKHIINIFPTLLDEGNPAASILSRVVNERERFSADNKAHYRNYKEAIEGAISDNFGARRVAWILQGYPSPTHHNNGLVCMVEIAKPNREYLLTWSNRQNNFLEIDTFRYTIFDVSRDANLSSITSISDFTDNHASWIVSHGTLPNWSALVPDYEIFSQ